MPFSFSASAIPVATGHDAPEHAVRVEVPAAEVLAPALAAADSRRAPHHLGEQAEGVVREREVVAVAAVVREDDVALGVEVVDDPHRVRLLPDVRVRRPDELPCENRSSRVSSKRRMKYIRS